MRNLFDLTGKVAVVVGGNGGIGASIAKGYAFYGASVIIVGRTEKTLIEAADEIKTDIGKTVDYMIADVNDLKSVQGLRDAVIKKYGKVDILVNSQGINYKFAALEAAEHIEEWDALYSTNVRSLMFCCTEFAKAMKENHYGRIINISSIRGLRAMKMPGNLAYGSAKGAVDVMTKYLAGELGTYGITVNAIGPIVTMTPMMKKLPQPPGIEEMFKRNVPLERQGLPEDNIGPAVFLGSDAGAFVTGQIIYPDGGMACV